MKKSILVIFILILQLSNTDAMGLRSGSLNNNINFIPNYEGTYYYYVSAYNNKPVDIEIYISDDNGDGTTSNLAQYFTPSEWVIKNVLPGQEPYFSVIVNLPATIDEPGTHKVHLGVREMIESEGGFAVRTAIESLFFIQVPFDGKYLKSSFSVEGANAGEPIKTVIDLRNLGDKQIDRIYANIIIIDSDGNTVTDKKTETVSLISQENKQIITEINSRGISPGEYIAEARVYADETEQTHSADFKVGHLNFQITNQTQEIFAGKINHIFVEAESEWANQVNGVYSEIKIGDQPEIRTLPENFAGFETKKVQGYFDASNLAPGTYDMHMKLNFEGNYTAKTTQINVVRDNILRLPNVELSLTNALFIAIIGIIVLINITLFILLMKKKEGGNNEK